MLWAPAGDGRIEVITGCMFSGKTEELLRRLKRATIAGMEVRLFKPAIDIRDSLDHAVSRDGRRRLALPIHDLSEVEEHLTAAVRVVAFDEAQFFGASLADTATVLANRGLRVVVSTLDKDYKGEPFGGAPRLLAIAEHVKKLYAICSECGTPASFSQRISLSDQEQILLGSGEAYQPRCRKHFENWG